MGSDIPLFYGRLNLEYTALYRRFRPQKFSEIYGQEHIVKTLQNQIIAGRVGHAYLFTGCRGCGKTTSAKILARAINCLNPVNGEPCNECSVCKAALNETLTDIVEMDAASNNGVDDVRAIRDEVNFLPTVAKYRVYIIDEVHMLSTGAFNALLKTLEEPPKHVKFILATTEPHKLPITILSRCQRFDFKAIDKGKIVDNLKSICEKCNYEFDEAAMELIAELSEGAMRDALSILERCLQDSEKKITLDKVKELVGIPEITKIFNIVEAIFNRDIDNVILLSNEIVNSGVDIDNFLFEIIRFLRDILVYKVGVKLSNSYTENDLKEIDKIIEHKTKEELIFLIEKISKIENKIKNSLQKSIVFQTELMMLCCEEVVEEKKTSAIKISTKIGQKVDGPSEKNTAETKIIDKSVNYDFWKNVLNKLKEENLYVLYSALTGVRVNQKDDLVVELILSNDFQKGIISKPEYIAKIKELISIEFNKEMMVKIVDNLKKDGENSLDLGFNINVIE